MSAQMGLATLCLRKGQTLIYIFTSPPFPQMLISKRLKIILASLNLSSPDVTFFNFQNGRDEIKREGCMREREREKHLQLGL